MAARNQHVQDSAVIERRLRPIYEWLDSGNPKKALQETEKVLRKIPNLQCAKALKALALLHLGKDAACTAILNALTEETPSDNSTLQAITICYRDLGQLEKVCQLYERAVRAEPTNEELHTHLFMSYVRTSNFKQQQQSAMALYKMKPKYPYYFWAVMSIVLQATRGQGVSDPSKRTVLLTLAERMIEKLIGENKVEAEQEVQLYLMILELQEKYEQALAVLEGPLGAKLTSGSIELQRIPYLMKLKRWADLNTLCTESLGVSMDRWDIWNHYLTSVFELSKSNEHVNNHSETVNDMDDNPEKAHEFICSLIENTGSDNLFKSGTSYHLRGPYLARFELCARLKRAGRDPALLLGDVFELFVEYFRLFGHKPCCVSDLRVYLHLLEPRRRAELASRLLKDVGISATTLPCTETQMQRHICSLQLSRLCGNHRNLDIEYLRALITALSLHYQNGAQSFGADRLPTDQGPADPYALLATHTLYDLAVATKSSGPLVTGLVLLETLLKRSPSNFHAKLLCIRLYHLLGGGDGAHKMYESLDTKHLQLDSLGFVHCCRIQTTGLFASASTLFDATLKFFSTNYRDSIDHLTFSYKYGSFLKLEEFMDFRERLNNSLHYTTTAIDRMLLEMVLCPNLKGLGVIDASPKNNNIDWEALRDNNNYEVYMSWDPERTENTIEDSEIVRDLFEQDKDVARLRASILCGVSSAFDILKSTDENREQCVKTLTDVHRNFLNTFEAVESRHCKTEFVQCHEQLAMPLPSRLRSHLQLPYKMVLGPLLQMAAGVASGKEKCEGDLSGVETALVDVGEHVVRIVNEQNENEDNLWNKYVYVEFVVNTVEILCISSILCGICFELLRPAHGKRNKKKSPETTHIKVQLDSLATVVRDICLTLDKTLDSWQPPRDPSDLADRLSALALSTDDDPSCSVLSHLRTSHINAIKELRVLLNSKVKYLNTLTGL